MIFSLKMTTTIHSSILLIAGRRYNIQKERKIDVNSEFIIIPIDIRQETLLVSLSFKHFLKIEIMDNGGAAGLIMHINDFMTAKLQNILNDGGTELMTFESPYSSNKFIVLDILNYSPQNLCTIRQILNNAGLFQHNYIVKQMNKNKKYKAMSEPFISNISDLQWNAMFSILGIEDLNPIIEKRHEINPVNNGNCEKKAIESVSIRPEHVVLSYPPNSRESYTVHYSDLNHLAMPKGRNNEYHYSNTLKPENTGYREFESGNQFLERPNLNPIIEKQHEIHPFDDENCEKETKATEVSNKFEHVVLSYPPNSQESCTVHYSDLNHLAMSNGIAPSPSSYDIPQYVNQSMPVHQFLGLKKSLIVVTKQQHKPQNIVFEQFPQIQNIISIEPTTSLQLNSPKSPSNNTTVISTRLKNPTPKPNKSKAKQHEIHLIDDEECEKEAIESVSKKPEDVVLSYPPNSRDSCTVHYSDLKHLAIDVMLNDTIIDFYLKYIHHSLVPENKRNKIHIFNTFFFARLTQAPPHGKPQVTLATKLKRIATNYQSVRNWTKKVDLFQMDYIVVPINEDIHWYLAIIVNPWAAIQSQITKKFMTRMDLGGDKKHGTIIKPYIIVLNSLIDPAVDKHIEVRSQLAEYLSLEFDNKHSNSVNKYVKEELKVVQPTLIPQQKGYIDCGLFLLHFAELFLTTPPEDIKNNASFSKWFRDFKIRDKRDEIKEVIRSIAPQINPIDFIYFVQPNNNVKTRKSKRQQQKSVLEAVPMMRRDRKQSESEIDDIFKDPRFSVLYRPRSLDSLLIENKDKPLVLQPPTIHEMKRYTKFKF